MSSLRKRHTSGEEKETVKVEDFIPSPIKCSQNPPPAKKQRTRRGLARLMEDDVNFSTEAGKIEKRIEEQMKIASEKIRNRLEGVNTDHSEKKEEAYQKERDLMKNDNLKGLNRFFKKMTEEEKKDSSILPGLLIFFPEKIFNYPVKG